MAIMTGKEALIQLLISEGVRYVFGLPGATEILFMDAMERQRDMKYILGLQENVVAGMAEGYARMAHKPGFVNLHTGTGLGAALPMLLNARAGKVPLVVTAGQQDNRLLLKDSQLGGNLVATAQLFSKWYTEATSVEDIPAAVQRGFKMAQQPPTGPVFISLPQNLLDEKIDFEFIPEGSVCSELCPDDNTIEKVVQLLIPCRDPIVLVESGITRDSALAEIVEFVELIGAKVYQPWMSDVNFPVQHHQYFGDIDTGNLKTNKFLESSDTVLFIGCPQFSLPTYQPGPINIKKTRIIQIDDDPWEIGKNFPVTAGIQGNIKTILAKINTRLKSLMSASDKEAIDLRRKKITSEQLLEQESYRGQDETEKDNLPISISRLMSALKNTVLPGTIIVDDCWSSSQKLRQILNLAEPDSYLRARRGGSIGWGLPGALGVKLAAPQRPVVAVSGDGSALWSIQSLWTAAHYKIPVTFVITANSTYRQVKLMRKSILGGSVDERHLGMELDEPVIDLCQLAQSMGLQSYPVKQPDELESILNRAFTSNTASLVEVKV